MEKSPDAFRTISEVASDLGMPQHVLRFWETKFPQIRPLKRGGGRRYYRPDDVDLLKGIRHLLYGEGYTIRGVQRILKENGVRFVGNVWREGAPQPSRQGARPAGLPGAYDPDPAEEGYEGDDAEGADTYGDGGSDWQTHEPDGDTETPAAVAAMAQRFAPRFGDAGDLDRVVGRPRDLVEAPLPRGAFGFDPAAGQGDAPRQRAGDLADPEPRSTLGHLIDRFRGNGRPAEGEGAGPQLNRSLSRDEVRRLQATLFELLECKRLLDQAR